MTKAAIPLRFPFPPSRDRLSVLALLALVCFSFSFPRATAAPPDPTPSREEVVAAMRKAAGFFRDQVGKEGAYHFHYAADLSYGRSEGIDSPTRIEVQREGTPTVALAFLRAYDATGEEVFLEAARQSAHAYVQGQLCSGGWDYSIEFDAAKRDEFPYRVDGACDSDDSQAAEARQRVVTTLDDNVTQAAMRVLMRVDRALNFEDDRIHQASLYALEQLMRAQYPNGAWPQRYSQFPDPSEHPVKQASYPEAWSWEWPGEDYRRHYTFNDNSIVDMIDVMLEASRIYDEPRYRASAEKGGQFMLLAQMPEPQPGWAQQYDREMHPTWARIFEPPSVTGGESRGVMRALLLLYRETGDRKYLEPLPRALEYYKASALPPAESPSEIRRRACPDGTKYCLARFYELRTNKPLYVTKGTRVGVEGRSTTLLDGYELSYDDDSVITHYGVLVSGDELDDIEAEYRQLLEADPATMQRPEKLEGLSPWSRDRAPTGAAGSARPASNETAAALAPKVREAMAALDDRGAWVEQGRIGKADRIVSVFAPREMVVTVGDQILRLRENDTLQVFDGEQEPLARIIRSRTFARNLGLLSDYVEALDR